MKKGPDEKFCQECGEIIRLRAEICPKCGVRQPYISAMGIPDAQNHSVLGQGQPRKKNVAGLLGLLLGGIGLHKFYMGKPIWGIAYIALCWTFLPAILGLIEGLNFLTMSEKTFNQRHAGPAWAALARS
jgi:TM2 domain-containing membrane protein YozV